MSGKIVEINRLTGYGMNVKLENGVSFDVSCNEGYIYLHFGGIDYDHRLKIREGDA